METVEGSEFSLNVGGKENREKCKAKTSPDWKTHALIRFNWIPWPLGSVETLGMACS
jgi:hypothetical protein